MKMILSVILLAAPAMLLAGPAAELVKSAGADSRMEVELTDGYLTLAQAGVSEDIFAGCAEFIEAEKARQNPSLDRAREILKACFSSKVRRAYAVQVVRKDFLGPHQIYVPGFSLKVRVLTRVQAEIRKISGDFNFSVNQERTGRLLGFPADFIIEAPKR